MSARRFASANRAEAVRQVEPSTPALRRAVTFFRERNVPVYVVRTEGRRGRVRAPAMWTAEGVVIDENAGAPETIRALVYHEAFHDLKRRAPEAWQKAYETVREFDPDGLAKAESAYFGDAEAQGLDVNAADRSDEAMARFAEGFSAWLERAQTDKKALRKIIRKDPDLFTRVVDAIQRAARSLGVAIEQTVLERRDTQISSARLATELSEALDLLKNPDLRPARAETNTRTDPIGGEVERVAFVRDRRGPEFNDRSIRRRLREIANDAGFEQTVGGSATAMSEQETADSGSDLLDTSFAGPVPGDIADAIQGDARLRMQFRGNTPGGRGEDVMSAIGADEMIRRARAAMGDTDAGAEAFLDGADSSVAPDLEMLQAIRRVRGGRPASELARREIVEAPDVLPDGATFQIEGTDWVVGTDEGRKVAVSADGRERFNLAGVETMPIDRDSLQRNARAEMPEMPDVLDDLPFAAAEADRRDISMLDSLPEPPPPSKGVVDFFRANDTRGMFDGINPDPETGLGMLGFRLRRSLQDKFLAVLRLQRAIKRAGGSVSDEANVYRAETLYYGRAAEQSRKFNKRFVEPLLKRMSETGVERGELDLYLYAKHAPERNAQIAETNPDFEGDGSGMSDADAAAIVERFESGERGQAFKDLAKEVAAIREWSLDFMVENDLLSKEQATAWREAAPNYVPLRTADNGNKPGGPRGVKGFEVRGPESKQAKGRSSLADSPLIFLIHQADHSIVRAERNRVGLAMMRLIKENPDKDLWNVYAPTVTRSNAPDLWGNEQTDIVPNPALPGDRSQANTLVVKEKGEERYLVIENENIVRALKNMGTQQMNWTLKMMSKGMRFISAMVTSLSPEFVITNFVRDIQTAGFNISAERDSQTAVRVTKNVGAAIRGALETVRADRAEGSPESESAWARTYREFVEDGGKTGWAGAYSFPDRLADIEKTAKAVNQHRLALTRLGRGAKNLVEDLNTAVENGVRVSLYAELRRQGVSRSEAAEAAKDLTVNFNRRGEAGTLLNALYLFYNAGVQGTVRMMRAANTPTGRKISGGIMGSAFLLAMLNPLLSDEDEDGVLFYDKISSWEKSNNLILMLPGTGGRYLKLPLPYGYSVFHAMGTHAASAARRQSTAAEAGSEVMASLMHSFNPIGGSFRLVEIVPDLIKPGFEVLANEDFAGRPINPVRFPGDNRPNSEVAFPGTSGTAKALASTINRITGGNEVEPGVWSPDPGSIDHWIDFATGTVGKFIKDGADLPQRLVGDEEFTLRSTPFIRRFMGEPASYRHNQQFWENRAEMDAMRSFERSYANSDRPERAVEYRAENETLLRAADKFQVYKRVVDDLRDQIAEGETEFTEDDLSSLQAEANRMVSEARDGEWIETPLLLDVPESRRLLREQRRRRVREERERARRQP